MQSYTDGGGAVFHWKKSAELGSILTAVGRGIKVLWALAVSSAL
jgi:hypothetical protein